MKKVSVLFATNSPLARGVAGGTRRGVAKKFIIAIMCVLGIATAYAENENAATSKEYVDAELATKQPTIPAAGNDVVMTFDSTAMDGIGTKQIYDESASYAEQQNALVTAGTANAAVQMAIQGEFECVLYDPDNPTDCWWWNIKSANQQRLPSGYTELEYIESTGTQYIDTEFIPQYSDCFYMDIAIGYQDQDATYRPLFGAASSGIDHKFYVSVGSNATWFANIRTHPRLITNKKSKLSVCINSAGLGTLYIDDVQAGQADITIENLSLKLFARNSTEKRAVMRMYDFNIVRNGNVARNFIPARQTSTGTLGMYDMVTNTFYTNDGEGTFVASPVYIPQNQ